MLAASGYLAAQNVTVTNAAYIVTTGSPVLSLTGGTIVNNGTITFLDASLKFSGAVSYEGSGTTFIKNLEIAHAGTSLLNNRVNVTGVLSVSNGVLHANDNLTLISNSSGSAIIAPLPSGSAITGKVTVERYIAQGKRAFRFLTPSVTTDEFISNNWQESTHITGSSAGANGFDATASGSPSLFTYDNARLIGTGWEAIPNTDATNLNALQGYRLLIRGDRTPSLITQTSQPMMNAAITLAATGTVVTGTVVFNSSSAIPINGTTNTTTNGYSFIGNPYVNTVDWNDLNKTGLTDAYYSWDANMGTAMQRGRYVAYSSSTGLTNSDSSMNQFIQPGQAFFVKNSELGTPGTITFTEANKLGTNINTFFRLSAVELPRLELQVYEGMEPTADVFPIDATVAIFDNHYTNAIEAGDVTKMSSGIENLSFLNSGLSLAIDARPSVTATDELQVQLQQFKANKSYTFKSLFSNFDLSTTPFLYDTYLNDYTSLANGASTNVSFITTADPLSYDLNRFKIVFQSTILSQQNFNAESVMVYPNPVTTNQFTIELPSYLSGSIGVKIINTIGQIVYETKADAQKKLIIKPTITLAHGIYLVQINHTEKTITKKITIQ